MVTAPAIIRLSIHQQLNLNLSYFNMNNNNSNLHFRKKYDFRLFEEF